MKKFKRILTPVSLIIIIGILMACKESPKVQVQEVTLTGVVPDTAHPPPPPPPPPENLPQGVALDPAVKKCYSNDGLKYNTTIVIVLGPKKVTGKVISEEIGSGEEKTSEFAGTHVGDIITVHFLKNKPIIGDGSEWTNKPWKLERPGPTAKFREKLHIIFNAKNYNTNKWKMTDYVFEMKDCDR